MNTSSALKGVSQGSFTTLHLVCSEVIASIVLGVELACADFSRRALSIAGTTAGIDAPLTHLRPTTSEI